MYENGQLLTADLHFEDHLDRDVPVQIYRQTSHNDIGFVQEVSPDYVKVNDTFYRRDQFVFISRPGY
jgi:hypothetical protein